MPTAPATANVTLTGTTGPDIDVVTKSFPGIQSFGVDFSKNVLTLKDGRGIVSEFDYAITATVTFTIAAGVATITIA